jgi:hypothetical protein
VSITISTNSQLKGLISIYHPTPSTLEGRGTKHYPCGIKLYPRVITCDHTPIISAGGVQNYYARGIRWDDRPRTYGVCGGSLYRRGRMYDHRIYNFLSLWLGAAGFGSGAGEGADKTMT